MKRVIAKRFIKILKNNKLIKGFDVDLYFKTIEKITVVDEKMLVVVFFDGTEVEWIHA